MPSITDVEGIQVGHIEYRADPARQRADHRAGKPGRHRRLEHRSGTRAVLQRNGRERRKARIRKALRIAGKLRPRLSVFRSGKNIYAQVIDDAKGVTVAAASTLEEGFRKEGRGGGNKEAAGQVGKILAERATKAGMSLRPFQRRFEKTTGLSVGEWLLKERLRHARDLLEKELAVSLDDIASISGFGTLATMRHHFRKRLGVVITDSWGRAWRRGTVGVALGVAGLPALMDMRGRPDLFERALRVTQTGFADEIASAASLVMGQADEARPMVLVRGVPWSGSPLPGAALIRPAEEDLFR